MKITKLPQLCKEFQHYKIFLHSLGLVRRTDQGEVTTTIGEKIIFSEERIASDFFSLTTSAVPQNKKRTRIETSRRDLARARNMTTVQSYAPTNVAKVKAKKAFYSCFTKVLSDINKRYIVIFVGDINPQVGHHNMGSDWRDVY